ncbi:methionine synthase [Deferribacter autotrophicus]|uniref:Methionine synthase n=1 Tax=Deferribacter autotrophicus TaxID=500465 RepID=A0A5A8EZN9_9BACT|nr:methionine synthase [Deferribacter autotrophicus]KAA0256834.1 methionine synthase [Deferribacter autotrophicus]
MFREFAKDNVVLFDGGMGTSIQKLEIPEDKWNGRVGCNEVLNLTYPEIIEDIHTGFFKAGADVVETNTFGASRLVLSEYNLEDKVYDINFTAAKIARKAADKFENKFVAGSIGPGTKLPSLGQISFDDLYKMYEEQISGLIDGGVDLLLIETCQDLLQIKSALLAAFNTLNKKDKELPVMVSVTIEQNGTMLLGSDLSAVTTVLRDYPIFSLGINCAVGPDLMYEPLKQLSELWDRKISCIPNAGLPQNINGKFVYDLTPEKMAEIMADLCEKYGLDLIGGCCGTTYEHIAALRMVANSFKPKAKKRYEYKGEAASLYTSTKLMQSPPPTLIGERANANGSKAFRELLLKDDFDGMVNVAKEQEDAGAHLIDVCVAYAERNEVNDMSRFVSMINTALTIPIVIDSTEPLVIENALKRYAGKPVINSINFEDGGEKLHKILKIVKKFPAAVIALTIDEDGMAMTAEKKFQIAKRIYDVWTKDYELNPEDLIFDPLTFSIGSGDETLTFAAAETLNAIKMIKENLQGAKTVLGVSNVSFGLAPHSRHILNSVFLNEAVKCGLDMAIVNPAKVIPLSRISENEVTLCLDLIYGKEKALERFLDYFSKRVDESEDNKLAEKLTPEEQLKKKVLRGDKSGLEELLDELLKKYSPIDIINNILIVAMKEVGDLFGAGKMLLPFVLQSAEVMKKSVLYLENFMEKDDSENKGVIVLATVKGDVHDIGKNLVDIILSNNGYKVYNLGIKVSVEDMILKAKEVNADAIGMSGLLVKSTTVMKDNIDEIKRHNLKAKILLGGAALTEGFVKNECEPILPGQVFYCRDAFDALKYLEKKDDDNNNLIDKKSSRVEKIIVEEELDVRSDIKPVDSPPKPPFFGNAVVRNISFEDVVKFMNLYTLFYTRWSYKKKDMSDEEYNNLLKKVAYPELEKIKNTIVGENLCELSVAYGYYKVKSNGRYLLVYDNDEKHIATMKFPRQKKSPYLCVADYFHDLESDKFDILPIQLVTIGEKPVNYTKKLFNENKYKEYFLYHGFFTELTEALAEYWHHVIRKELGIENEDLSVEQILNMRYQGRRYSFGYPSCPDLEGNLIVHKLLNGKEIGVELTEGYEMVPEYTTSAIIVHHPEANYFVT